MIKSIVALSVAAVLLAGCATGYQKKGFHGGYSEAQLDDRTVRVTYEGDGRDITESNIFNYLMYRCAEVTIQKGFDYFIREDMGASSTQGGLVPIGGMLMSFSTAVSSATISMGKGPKPTTPNSYDARLLIKNLAQNINSPPK